MQKENFGKSQSNGEVEIGVPIHVAIVVDGVAKRIQLFMNGELDFQKELKGRDTFVPGHGPLYIGRDPWHKSAAFIISRFGLHNRALSSSDILEVFRSQHDTVHALTSGTSMQKNIGVSDSIFTFTAGEESATGSSSNPQIDSSSSGGLTAALLAKHDGLQNNQQQDVSDEVDIGSSDSDHDEGCSNDNDTNDQFLDSLSLVHSEMGGMTPAPPASTATSQYTVRPSHHLQQRQQQRDINLRELQLARKHGVCYETGSGRLVYAYEDVIYVTDSTGRRGITAWRLKRDEDGEVNMHVPNLFEIHVTVIKK